MNELGPRCLSCAAELPSAFPGASLVCVCGQRVEIAGAGVSQVPSPGAPPGSAPPRSGSGGGPYRSAGVTGQAAMVDAPCPYCGNDCPPMVRLCPHCDVRLDNVRCQRCFSLQAPGMFSCARCAHPLELEPLLDATDAPCPRCNHPLEVSSTSDPRVHECPACGGTFVPRDLLTEILCTAELGGGVRDSLPRVTVGAVRYLSCPLCHTSMNRVNFGRVSGVVVDVCKMHGTWFDAGELTRVVAFASSGGLEKTRAREQDARRDERKRDAEVHAQLALVEATTRHRSRADDWDEFLRAIFFW